MHLLSIPGGGYVRHLIRLRSTRNPDLHPRCLFHQHPRLGSAYQWLERDGWRLDLQRGQVSADGYGHGCRQTVRRPLVWLHVIRLGQDNELTLRWRFRSLR
jgi:hypothetical protein